jgi:PST family polysaccharide transporter
MKILEEKMAKNISIKKATVIYGVAKYSTVFVQLIISAVLSRILTPNDYGIVAVVTIFTTLFNILANLGLGTAVTQYKELSKQDVQDVFTFSEYVSVVLAFVFTLMSYPISVFYNDNVYIPITLMLSISVLFNALNMVPNALLLKEKEFFKVGVRMIISTLGSGVIAILLALLGAKYYALVMQSILNAFITFIWNYKGTDLRFKIHFSFEPIKQVKDYSINQFLYNIVIYFEQNLDNLLIGKLMGNEMLAYYNKGYTLMRYPVNNIAHAITPVLHPILSEHQKDKKFIYDEFVKIAKILSLIGVFITAFCFWADTEIVICYFGSQWYEAVSTFKWLSICLCAQLLNALAGSIFQSIGCTKQMLQSGLFHVPISFIAIIIGAYSKNITILAILVSVSMIIKFFVLYFFLIKKSFGFSLKKFFVNFIPDSFIFIMMILASIVIGDFEKIGLWTSLLIKLGISSVLFMILIIVTKQTRHLIVVFPAKVQNKIKWICLR